MTEWRAAYLAGRREVRERFRNRAYRISTLVQVLAVVAIAVIASVTGGGASTVDVGYVGPAGKAVVDRSEAGQRALDLELQARSYDTLAAARQAIVDGDVELVAGGRENLVAADAPAEAEALLRETARQVAAEAELRRFGLDPQQIATASSPDLARFETVEAAGSGGQGIAFIATLLLYLALIFAGYAVSSGVTEEKSTRVVEIIINAIKPRSLLAGKVAGIGLVGLAQLLLIIVAGLAATLAMGSVDLPEGTLDTAALALVYFILGYGLYGCGFAVAGSLVSRQEDTQSTTAPVMMVLVAAYILSISVTDDPTSGLAVLCTYLPPLAPMVVPARAAAGELPLDQLAVSLALMGLACVALTWLAGRVYERSVLRMGAPVRLRELPSLIRG